jgi:hypothetical protein
MNASLKKELNKTRYPSIFVTLTLLQSRTRL